LKQSVAVILYPLHGMSTNIAMHRRFALTGTYAGWFYLRFIKVSGPEGTRALSQALLHDAVHLCRTRWFMSSMIVYSYCVVACRSLSVACLFVLSHRNQIVTDLIEPGMQVCEEIRALTLHCQQCVHKRCSQLCPLHSLPLPKCSGCIVPQHPLFLLHSLPLQLQGQPRGVERPWGMHRWIGMRQGGERWADRLWRPVCWRLACSQFTPLARVQSALYRNGRCPPLGALLVPLRAHRRRNRFADTNEWRMNVSTL
jgi:hypothetical protein